MASTITWKTEIALGSSPNSPLSSQLYTDVSAWAREEAGVSLSRGRSDEHAEMGPSTLTLTLDNTDGRFTPGNPSSPYGTNVDIGTMIRRTVTIDGTPYVRFTGYIDEINIPEWANSPFEKVVEIAASDRLARMAHERSGTMLSQSDYEHVRASVSHYWPLDEEAEATQATAMVGVEPLTVVNEIGAMEFGGADGPPTDTARAATFEAPVADDDSLLGMSDYLQTTFRTGLSYSTTGAITVSAWVRPTYIWNSATQPRPVKLDGSDFVAYIYVDMTSRSWMARVQNVSGSLSATATGPMAAVDKLYHVAMVMQAGQLLRLYVDGVQYTGNACPSLTQTITTLKVGAPFTGGISNVAVWRSAITTSTVQKVYAAGNTGTRGMNSADAMALLASYAGIPANEIVSTPRGTTAVGNIPTYGRSRVDVLKDVALAEGGILFVNGSGILQFHTRAKRWNAGTATFTLPIGDIVQTFSITYNDAFVINEARVKRVDGSESTAIDTASQTKRGIYAEEVEARFLNDNEPPSRCRYLVQTYKDPKSRLGTFPVRVTTSLAAQTLAALEIGSLIAVGGLSADAPTFGNQWIEGISEFQSVNDYTLTLTTSPVYPTSNVAYFTIGTGTSSRIGSTAIIAP